MPAYVISEVEIIDEKMAKHYMRLAEASIKTYGGRYIVRGAKADVMEGEPNDRRIIIVEFPSLERAKEWYASPAYAEALKFRYNALNRKLTFVDGITPFSTI